MSNGRVTVLVEDTTGGHELRAEHGLALWIEFGTRKILFDTGQSDMLLHNAQVLGVDLSQVEAIVLSHGHYDHVGGLEKLLEIAPAVPVYLHPQALQPKFAGSERNSREIGIQPKMAALLERRLRDGRGTYTEGPTEIFPGAWVTGQIPRRSTFEDTGGPFFANRNATRPDALLDDQALVLKTGAGLVVVLGCAHAGVVNTLDYVAELFPGQAVQTVLGGMHLIRASQARIAHTIQAIRRLDVQRIVPGHCTGREAVRELLRAFAQSCLTCTTGTELTF